MDVVGRVCGIAWRMWGVRGGIRGSGSVSGWCGCGGKGAVIGLRGVGGVIVLSGI